VGGVHVVGVEVVLAAVAAVEEVGESGGGSATENWARREVQHPVDGG